MIFGTLPKRYILAFLSWQGIATMYMTRMNINIAIIGMAKKGGGWASRVLNWKIETYFPAELVEMMDFYTSFFAYLGSSLVGTTMTAFFRKDPPTISSRDWIFFMSFPNMYSACRVYVTIFDNFSKIEC